MTKEIGDSTLSDTWASDGGIEEPDLSKKEAGWLGAERPAYQFMNFLFNDIQKKINHIMKNGVPLWNTTTTYAIGNIVANDGVLYIATASNTNSEPPSANWESLIESFLPLNNYSAVTNPGVGDDSADGYSIGSKWINTSASPREAFMCLDASVGAAVWVTTTLDFEDLGSAALADSTDFATAAQGALADTALQPGFQPVFKSTAQTVTAGGTLNLPHSLGSAPNDFFAYIQCTTAEAGFAIGDRLRPDALMYTQNSVANYNWQISSDATNVTILFGAGGLLAKNESTGAITALTAANWQLYAVAINW